MKTNSHIAKCGGCGMMFDRYDMSRSKIIGDQRYCEDCATNRVVRSRKYKKRGIRTVETIDTTVIH